MARVRHLKNAPITEALIDFQSHSTALVDATAAARLGENLGPSYSLKGPMRLANINAGTAPTLAFNVETQDLGYRFESLDGKFVAQFQNQAFTLSRLAPYAEWADLKQEAQRLWPIYVEVAATQRVHRVACRYINNLALPMYEKQDFRDYLTAAPEVPKELPQTLMGFMQRVVINQPEVRAITILTQLLEPNATTSISKVPVILDVDVQTQQVFEPSSPDLWDILEVLRALKNAAFFESITEAAAEVYE
jgi:uncharacterized protein (TIGR04255 family)